MNYLSALYLLIISSICFAQTIEVPENCINNGVSPCLLRTEDNSYKFKFDGQQIVILKEAILKISSDKNKNNIEIIEGRMSLTMQKKASKLLTINDQPIKRGRLLISRFSDDLKILDLRDYVLAEYGISPDSISPDRKFALIRAEFINKKDFISFTKDYFQSVGQYNRFLAEEAPKWKIEFHKQNSLQTKVLLRSIASEKEKTKIKAEKRALEAAELKKIRDQFFYRTFLR